ncbi:MAG: LysR family transcriptional regulator [Pseudomonadota bacterium]
MGRHDRPGIDIRRLRYFLAVCEHGGFSRAASAIGVAQPALTRHVQQLEQDLGMELVARNGRGASPTEPGRFLVEHARAHIDGLDRLYDRLIETFGRDPGTITLGICPTVTPLFLDAIQSFVRNRLPNTSLSVIEAYSGDLAALMKRGRIDVALTYQPAEQGLARRVDLLSERLVLVARADRGLPRSEPSVADLVGLPLILPSQIHQLRRIIDRVCEARGVHLLPSLELDSLSAVKQTLDDPQSDYVTILPCHSVLDDARDGRFVVAPVADPGMVRTVSLMTAAGPGGRKVPEAFVTHIRNEADRLRRTLGSVF